MARIQSNIELIYDSRNQLKGIIRLEISDWKYELSNSRYIAVVDDFVVESKLIDGKLCEQTRHINTKNAIYSKEMIDNLFTFLANPIGIDESFSTKLDYIIAQALLYVTMTEPIYGSGSNNWEILPDSTLTNRP